MKPSIMARAAKGVGVSTLTLLSRDAEADWVSQFGTETHAKLVEQECEWQAQAIFEWLGANLPTGTYHRLRGLILEEIQKDSE
jgi:hypothetical protein